jgi:glycosyltransferase involved in cell wall biosynthesis
MRIAYITAGAGNMYCGSCLRDNTLARTLMQAGHDVLLVPTYTPTRSDEPNVSSQRMYLGGINVYLQQHFDFFRKSPQMLDRILDYKPLLKFVSRLGLSVDPANLGELTVSMLLGTKGFLRKEILRMARFLAKEFSPEIVTLPNSLLISLAPALKAERNVPICCTLQGEDFFLNSLSEPYRSQSIQIIREQAQYVDGFIAVSHFGARSMADLLGIPLERIHVVPLGINCDGFGPAAISTEQPFTIGYLARIAPEKGLRVLCDSYQILLSHQDLPPSRLWAAGYFPPEHKPYLADIQKDMHAKGLSNQFAYHGELDRLGKQNFLRSLSVFSVPAPYPDVKGLFLLEAMASGIPVVQPRRGAFTEIIETTGGGILVEPDNPNALAQGFLDLWGDPARRIELGAQGYRGVREHYSATKMAEKALSVYQTVLKSKKAVSAESPGSAGLSPNAAYFLQ